MTTPRPLWRPTDYAEAVKDIANGLVEESSYLELKRQLSSNNPAAQIRKGLQALANNGGSFAIARSIVRQLMRERAGSHDLSWYA